MSDYVATTISRLQSLLFNSNDKLNLGSTLDNVADLSVTSDGLTTTLSKSGFALSLPAQALAGSSQSGYVTFPNGSYFVTGTSLGETLSALNGDSAVYGQSGNDTINGGSGHDNLFGGSGSDVIRGNDGNDHLYGYGPVAGPDSADQISGGSGDDYLQGNAGNDTLNGDDGNDRIFGGADDDRIWGGNGNDIINGNFGQDLVDGQAGDDVLRGGKGSDTILGGDGNDQIYGDLGADSLSGGSGADVFYFKGNDASLVSLQTLIGNIDTITDFQTGADKLSLGFNPSEVIHGTAQSSLEAALFYVQTLLSGHAGNAIAAVGVGSEIVLFYNTSGNGAPDSVIGLENVNPTTLTITDFI